ncbi:MAG: hypothetical protein CM15mP77_2720 [Synechococcus sp.]|nr:MAG: hypothetical protein CM15mP77_2720 [Synechococcus sp.]
MLDWRGSYPDPRPTSHPVSCSSPQGDVCLEGEAAISGSFWSSEGLQKSLTRTDRLRGAGTGPGVAAPRGEDSRGAAYIPVGWKHPGPGANPA